VSDARDDSLLDHPVVAALLERLADLVAARVQPGEEGRYYTAVNNPLGSVRAFRDAASRGDFPSFKLGREIAAKRSDVHAWIEGRTKRPSVKKAAAATTDDDDAMLAEFGVRASRKRGAR
jgi:hypothetical protein